MPSSRAGAESLPGRGIRRCEEPQVRTANMNAIWNRRETNAAVAIVVAFVLALAWACAPEQTPAAQAVTTQRAPDAQRPVGTSGRPTRVEKDLLGEKAVPANPYYGVQTARTPDNFQTSRTPLNPYPR